MPGLNKQLRVLTVCDRLPARRKYLLHGLRVDKLVDCTGGKAIDSCSQRAIRYERVDWAAGINLDCLCGRA